MDFVRKSPAWVNGNAYQADDANRVEDGVVEAVTKAEAAQATATAASGAASTNTAAIAAANAAIAAKANTASPTFTGTATVPALRVTGGSPSSGKVLTSDGSGNATWQTPSGGSAPDASYARVVIVVTGTEARPVGATVVLWIDTRESPTRPDNIDNVNDLWFTPNGAPSGDTTAPSVPTGLSSGSITSAGFTVNWSASTDNVAVTGYQIRTGTDAPISVGTTSYAFTGLSASTAYSVTVRARDAAGNWSAWSSALSVTTGSDSDATAPSVPTGLVSSSITSSGFTVSWTASTDNVAVTGYEVFLDGVSYATPSGTSQVVTGLSASTAYSVTVRARDAAGNWSAQSSALSITTDSGGSAPSPTSRFNFNEGSGTAATSVAGGYSMTDQTGGSPVWGASGVKSDFAGYLDGSVAATYSDWSLALDVIFTDTGPGAEKSIFWHRNGGGYFLNILADGKVKWYGASAAASTSSISFPATKRIVLTQSSTTLKVYVDGVEVISSAQANSYNRAVPSDVCSGAGLVNTEVDTLRFWGGTALTADQVIGLGS